MRYVLFVFLFFFASCASIKNNDFIGNYCNITIIGGNYISIKKDSSFVYECQIPLNFSKSAGKWNLKNKKIHLKSEDFFRNDYFEVIESTTKSKKIEIIENENFPVVGVNVLVNSEYWFVTDENGFVDLDTLQVPSFDKIQIYYIDLSESKNTYLVKNITSNTFTVKLFPKDYGRYYFDNEIVTLKKNQIIIGNQVYKKIQ